MPVTNQVLGLIALAGITLAQPAPRAQPLIPAPESVIGFAPCSDYKLATHEQITAYLRQLDRASDRMQLVEIGSTVEGRTQLIAIISSESNLRDLARYKDVAKRLALARGLTDEQARALASEGKAVVWIDFGLHSNEVAPAQTAPLVAYRAVTDDSSEMQRVREEVIFLLMPDMNPDGTTQVANWYMTHVGGPFEDSSPPELYHRYAGHDNNRDWFMFNMPESRNVARQLYAEWFPQIVYNQHQAGPFPSRIFVPPFDDPMNPNIPPLVMRGVNLVGDAIARRLDQEDKRGAISRVGFDTWWNGGMRTAPYFHNMIGILTETSHPSATPAHHDPRSFPKTFPNGISTVEPSTSYPSPYLGGEWHLRDSCEYIASASNAVLDLAAARREEWLLDIYRMGKAAIAAGGTDGYAVRMDNAQWDPGTAAKMLETLRLGGVEVSRAVSSFASGRQYPAGTFLIRDAQAFRPYLTDLLNPQLYPDLRLYPGGPPKRPYDITGWTLPLQMGVTVDRIAVPESISEVGTDPIVAPGRAPARARVAYAIDPRGNDAFRAVNRLLKAGERVFRSPAPLTIAGVTWPPGSFVVLPGAETLSRIGDLVTAFGLRVAAIDSPLTGNLWAVRPPRVGVYHGYGGNIDEGWTRWVLEQFEFPYTRLLDRDVRAGALRNAYDVIVLPAASYESMRSGLATGNVPPEFTGGMTDAGLANLEAFVVAGGTLVTLDDAAELPIAEFDLPVKIAPAGGQDGELFAPGALLRIQLDGSHPIAFGMPAEAAAFFAGSPIFDLDRPDDPGQAVSGRTKKLGVPARYPGADLLMSGWILGGQRLASRPAVIEAPVGAGRVVLLGFRVQHRGQPHGTFKLLFNSLFLGSYDGQAFAP